MANLPISGLPTVTGAETTSGDQLPIVNGGATKSITRGELLGMTELSTNLATYVVFQDGLDYHARNGKTGVIESSSTTALTVIQYALDNLTVSRVHKEKVALQGTFGLTSSIDVPSYTSLDLTEAKITQSSNADAIHVDGSSTPRNDVAIYGGTIIMTGTTFGVGVMLEDSTDILVTGVTVIDAGSESIETHGCSRVIITENILVGAGDDGVSVLANSSFVTVSNNAIRDNRDSGSYGSSGIEIEDGATDVTVTGNVISNIQGGSGGNGIYVVVDAGEEGVYLAPKRITISGNVIRDCAKWGIAVNSDITDVCEDIVIVGNVISNTGSAGMQLSEVNRLILKDNTVTNTATQGINIGVASYVSVSGNITYNTGGEGVAVAGLSLLPRASANEIVFQGNSVTNPGVPGDLKYGFSFSRVTNLTVLDNVATDDRPGTLAGMNYGFRTFGGQGVTLTGNNLSISPKLYTPNGWKYDGVVVVPIETLGSVDGGTTPLVTNVITSKLFNSVDFADSDYWVETVNVSASGDGTFTTSASGGVETFHDGPSVLLPNKKLPSNGDRVDGFG